MNEDKGITEKEWYAARVYHALKRVQARDETVKPLLKQLNVEILNKYGEPALNQMVLTARAELGVAL